MSRQIPRSRFAYRKDIIPIAQDRMINLGAVLEIRNHYQAIVQQDRPLDHLVVDCFIEIRGIWGIAAPIQGGP
ncbi:hypothetical protein ACFWBH_01010 [Streptomyces sp. NPDC059999]|uniref:hypothetical protein n=1 Tax=Streptomyces sp. NPDC059999 TaxID=3347030 RepID=UPI0036CEADB8